MPFRNSKIATPQAIYMTPEQHAEAISQSILIHVARQLSGCTTATRNRVLLTLHSNIGVQLEVLATETRD